jgi:hypothetical protein
MRTLRKGWTGVGPRLVAKLQQQKNDFGEAIAYWICALHLLKIKARVLIADNNYKPW